MSKEIIKYELESPLKMAALATVIKDHVIKNKLITEIQGKNYVQVDGWTFAGGQMGIYPKMKQVTNLSSGTEKKWMAEVELVRFSDDKVVGHGFGICSSIEAKKKSFDEYAILSQAQTRAIGKAFRNLIGWIMKLDEKGKHFESTPAEEMHRVGEEPTIQINVPDEVGIQAETEQIQEILGELGYKTPTSQLKFIQAFCKKKGYKYDAWKMGKGHARELLAGLLKMKLEKQGHKIA